jgi:hypothetical protein
LTFSDALAGRGWKCGGNGKYPLVGKSDVTAVRPSCAKAQDPHVNERKIRPQSNLCMLCPIDVCSAAGWSGSHHAIEDVSSESNRDAQISHASRFGRCTICILK